MEKRIGPKLSSPAYRVWIFMVGIIATIAYRLVIVLSDFSPYWLEVAWYVGTVGFIWYFGHRWAIERRRDRLIEELGLVKKIEDGQVLGAEDREATVYILKGLSTSLAKWNYVAIFIFSFLAMGYAVWSDLWR